MKMICPHCGVRGSAEDSLRDIKVKCPKCNGLFVADVNNIVAVELMDGQFSVDNSDGISGIAGNIGTDYIADSDEILDESEIDKILSGHVEEDQEIPEDINDVLIAVEEPPGGEDKADEVPGIDVDESLSDMDSYFDEDLPGEGTYDEFSVEELDELLGDSDTSGDEDEFDSLLDEDPGMSIGDEAIHDSTYGSRDSDESQISIESDTNDIWGTGSEVAQKKSMAKDAEGPVKCAACGEYFEQRTGYKLGTTLYCDKCVPRKNASGRDETGEPNTPPSVDTGKQKGFLSRLFSRKK